MTHPIRLIDIEKNNLIGLCHRFRSTHMAHVDTSIGKYNTSLGVALVFALVSARTRAYDIPHSYRVGNQQGVRVDIRHVGQPHRRIAADDLARLRGTCSGTEPGRTILS